jgi:hypothetical protein
VVIRPPSAVRANNVRRIIAHLVVTKLHGTRPISFKRRSPSALQRVG